MDNLTKKRKTVNKVCLYCKKDFKAVKYEVVRRGRGKYCSQKCKGSFESTSIGVSCAVCNKRIKRKKSLVAKSKTGLFFCSKEHQTKLRKKEKGNCLNCNKLLSKSSKKYCDNLCQNKYYYKEYIKRWKKGEETGIKGVDSLSIHIRNYLFEKYNNRCCKCGWEKVNPFTSKIPLTVNHIDGDYANNKEENLELICPNCHSLTPNYGARNKGKGRPGRQIWRKKNSAGVTQLVECDLSKVDAAGSIPVARTIF